MSAVFAPRKEEKRFVIKPSAENRPPPLIKRERHKAIARRWYSKPSPPCLPDQFIKKPFPACAMTIAPDIMNKIPMAQKRVRNPAIKPSAPRDSPRITNMAKIIGIPIWLVKNPNVPSSPYPPNHPRSFWAPWGSITIPSITRIIRLFMLSSVWKNAFIWLSFLSISV